jgi:predicted DNA-binding ribbon-helix-helix protein
MGSVSLEDAFWNNFKEIAQTQRATLSELVGRIDGARQHSKLSSAIRLFVLRHFHEQTEVADIHHAGVSGGTAQALRP